MSETYDFRDRKYVPADIKQTLLKEEFPTVMMWNRLEGRPRTHHFNKALKAEVRDALWMLTKQWQMSEFKGDDSGTPVFAKVHIKTSHLDTYTAADKTAESFENIVPLETKVEQKKIPFTRNGKGISIDIRLQMGNYWLKLLDSKSLNFRNEYIAKYGFNLPVNNRGADHIYAHKDVWQQYAAISGRSMDGLQLYEYVITAGNLASDGITNTDPEKTALDTLGIKFRDWFLSMYYQPVKEENNAWLPDQLEYRFTCSATAGNDTKTIAAEEYYQGHLDWYAFDISQAHSNAGPQKDKHTSSFIPTHVEFEGMPNTRWWKFEDGKTDLGDIKPSTSELPKLLLMEFGLVFANDWFIIPFSLPVGSLANVEGLTVRNNFGETTWIQSSEATGVNDTVWSMYKLASAKQNNTLFLAPAAMKVHEGNPLEEIVLIRDEMSNMVWGIETIVPTAAGRGIRGSELALRVRQFHEKFVSIDWIGAQSTAYIAIIDSIPGLSAGININTPEILKAIYNLLKDMPDFPAKLQAIQANLTGTKKILEKIKQDIAGENPNIAALKDDLNDRTKDVYTRMEEIITKFFDNSANKTELDKFLALSGRLKRNEYAANISYLAMTEVPENWIPFVPVHINNDNREIQLQRASNLRIIEGDPVAPQKIKPQTSILREGLENVSKPSAYYIHEEEVPRAGVRVLQSFQRTRWVNGEVFVWLGMKKKTGRGEGSGGLQFDKITDVKE